MKAAKDQRAGNALEFLSDGEEASQPHAADILKAVKIGNQVLSAMRNPVLAGFLELMGVFRVHPASHFQQHRFVEFRWFDVHTPLTVIVLCTVCYDSAFDGPRRPIKRGHLMNLSPEDLEKLRSKLRFKVCYDVGFACPDVDDIVQESLARFLAATSQEKIHNPDAAGAFINGVCRNVIWEYRRRAMREDPMPEVVPEPPGKSIPDADLFDLRQAISLGLEQLSERDRRVLRGFYLEEKSKEEILKETGLSDENFRVVICRAKERFRAIYVEQTKHRGPWRH